MAELVWQGKHLPGSPNTSTAPATLTTLERYPPSQEQSVEQGWQNRLIQAEKSLLLPLLCTDFAESVKLIYIDPPFMTGRSFHHGTQLAYRDTWRKNLDSYLQWLYETFFHLHRLLASNGSLYVHLDWRTAHYAKLLLDELFRATDPGAGFKNEIIWHYQSGGRPQKYFARKHDTLLFYTKSGQYDFHAERVAEKRGAHRRNHMRKEVQPDGRTVWTIRSNGRLYTYSEEQFMSLADVWSDISHLQQRDPERTGYATQKPEGLLERILLTSSEVDDLVLDCFSGSGVTAAVAERLQRRWIVSDQSELAISLSAKRLRALELHHPFVLQCLQDSTL